jgi:hypothetical protein
MRTFLLNITADDPVMVARSKYGLSQPSPLSENCALQSCTSLFRGDLVESTETESLIAGVQRLVGIRV